VKRFYLASKAWVFSFSLDKRDGFDFMLMKPLFLPDVLSLDYVANN
jgi:hypothetical protein